MNLHGVRGLLGRGRKTEVAVAETAAEEARKAKARKAQEQSDEEKKTEGEEEPDEEKKTEGEEEPEEEKKTEDEEEPEEEKTEGEEEPEEEMSAEQQRIAAILEAPEAKGREAQARQLALRTRLSVKEARAVLHVSPKHAARGQLGPAMAGVRQPDVGAGDGGAGRSEVETVAKRIAGYANGKA